MTDKPKPVFIMVPRKLVIAWIVSFVGMLVMTLLSMQYANYVDRRSNQLWCGIVVIYDNAATRNPPPSEAGRQFAAEMHKIRNKFDC